VSKTFIRKSSSTYLIGKNFKVSRVLVPHVLCAVRWLDPSRDVWKALLPSSSFIFSLPVNEVVVVVTLQFLEGLACCGSRLVSASILPKEYPTYLASGRSLKTPPAIPGQPSFRLSGTAPDAILSNAHSAMIDNFLSCTRGILLLIAANHESENLRANPACVVSMICSAAAGSEDYADEDLEVGKAERGGLGLVKLAEVAVRIGGQKDKDDEVR
jgi:hypothetical protein